jgi:integrase
MITGLSKEDILCLEHTDVKKDGLHANRRKTGAKPKVYRWDTEGVLEDVLDTVRAAHKGHVGSMRLFHARNGKPYYEVNDKGHAMHAPHSFNSMWQRLMNKWVRTGGARFTEHDLRAKAASDTDIGHTQQLMDHASSEITEKV